MSDNIVMKTWGKLRGILWVAMFVVLLSACSDDFMDSPPVVPVAYVTLYHGSPDAPELDVVVDNRSIFSNEFEYTDYTGYLNFYTGERNFKFNPFNAANPLVDTTFSLKQDRNYSVFVIDQLAGIEALLVQDSADAPSQGNAMVRFVHLSPDASSVDVSIAGNTDAPLFADQTFKKATVFKEVSAEKLTFEMKTAGGDDAIVSAPDITLQPGRYYTIIARGFANPPQGNNHGLSLQVVANQ